MRMTLLFSLAAIAAVAPARAQTAPFDVEVEYSMRSSQSYRDRETALGAVSIDFVLPVPSPFRPWRAEAAADARAGTVSALAAFGDASLAFSRNDLMLTTAIIRDDISFVAIGGASGWVPFTMTLSGGTGPTNLSDRNLNGLNIMARWGSSGNFRLARQRDADGIEQVFHTLVTPAPSRFRLDSITENSLDGAVFVGPDGFSSGLVFQLEARNDASGTASFRFGTMPAGISWSSQDGNFLANFVANPNSDVPEPGSWAMMITGFGAVGIVARRRVRYRKTVTPETA
jgi:hypothetical protein